MVNPQLPLPTLKDILKTIYPVRAFLYSFKPPPPTRIIKTFISLLFTLFLVYSIFHHYILKDLPPTSTLASRSIPLTTHIRDRNGIELYKVYLSQNRTLIKLIDLPNHLIHATLAIEDKDFYSHKGYSLKGVLRALWHILTKNRLEGGSTITQQLVKTSLLSPERTLSRKLKELILAVSVEAKYSKDQILEMYLNRVSYGGSSYGVEEAAQAYFGKSAKDLNLAESALLAGLPAAPTTFSPHGSRPETAKERQKTVLRKMYDAGFISWEDAETASAQNLTFKPPTAEIKAPHFVMYVREILSKKYGPVVVEQGGLDVTTTLDLHLQNEFEKIVAEETAKIRHLNIKNGAGLVTRPATGEILAMVGSRDYFDLSTDGNVNITLRPRQPGSAIKPINYALSFSKGWTAGSIIEDSPVTYHFAGQPAYSPTNYDRKYHGPVSLRTALASSYNIPAVKLLASNGVANMIKLGQEMGITTWNDISRFGLSLTLGGGEVTMLDLATAYGVLANSGRRVDLYPILSVKDFNGRILEEYTCSQNPQSCPSRQVLSPQIAFLITDILSDNTARAPAFGASSLLFFKEFPVAVKTGTTNNLRDNWTIGYTSEFLAATWVGNNDNSPMSFVASGVTGASPIWHRITKLLLSKFPPSLPTPPEGIVRLHICPSTGQLSCDSCPGKPEYFISGTEPVTHCSPSNEQEPTSAPPQNQILEGLSIENSPPLPTRRARPHPRLRDRQR